MILVIGDLFLDQYTNCTSSRMSPEFNVPVLNFINKDIETNYGGAGNVLNNLLSLKEKVFLLSRVGSDETGTYLKKKLKKYHIINDKNCVTIIKNRLISNNTHLCRMDYEEVERQDFTNCNLLEKTLQKIKNKVSLVIISDYGKGFINKKTLKIIFKVLGHKKILVDPDQNKKISDYNGCYAMTPNLKEFNKMTNLNTLNNDNSIKKNIKIIKKKYKLKNFIITRGHAGNSALLENNKIVHFPVYYTKEVFDVSGAGDTFISIIAKSMSLNLDFEKSLILANNCCSYVVAKKNTQPIELSEFNYELKKIS